MSGDIAGLLIRSGVDSPWVQLLLLPSWGYSLVEKRLAPTQLSSVRVGVSLLWLCQQHTIVIVTVHLHVLAWCVENHAIVVDWVCKFVPFVWFIPRIPCSVPEQEVIWL